MCNVDGLRESYGEFTPDMVKVLNETTPPIVYGAKVTAELSKAFGNPTIIKPPLVLDAYMIEVEKERAEKAGLSLYDFLSREHAECTIVFDPMGEQFSSHVYAASRHVLLEGRRRGSTTRSENIELTGIFGLPCYFADTVVRILDPGGRGSTNPKEVAWNRRASHMLVAFALFVFVSPEFKDKTWGSVVQYVSDSSELAQTRFLAMIAHASAIKAKPGSVERLVSNLAQRFLDVLPRECAVTLSQVRACLGALDRDIAMRPIIEIGEGWAARGKGVEFAAQAAGRSCRSSLFVYDEASFIEPPP